MTDVDIPRSIVDDPEQCVAFALGAMGHPCSLIQGPPGTGKTTVASHLAHFLQEKGCKTLILSHSNKGLDVLLRATQKRGVAIHRGGTDENVCDEQLKEAFLRRGLRHPRKSEFLVNTFDQKTWDQEQALFLAEERLTTPARAECMRPHLDTRAWKEAWRDYDARKRQIIEELSHERGLVVGVTLNSLLTDEIVQSLDFDAVIVDEASKGRIHEWLPALRKAGKQIIFIGDHKQLGNVDLPSHLKNFLEDREATVDPMDEQSIKRIGKAEIEAYDRGPFSSLARRADLPKVMLRTNRRALPNLVALVSHAGYGGKLKAGRVDPNDPGNHGELVWVDTSKRPDKTEVASGVSKVNPLEARLLARRLLKDYQHGKVDAENFGVITMYRSQGSRIRVKAEEAAQRHLEQPAAFGRILNGNVSTVDAFQGSERERIYLATTRSNPHGKVGFLDKVERVNVACSRARDALVIVGDRATLIDNNPDPESRAYFAVAYEICKQRGAIIDTFSAVTSSGKPEKFKSRSHSVKLKKARKAWKQRQTREV